MNKLALFSSITLCSVFTLTGCAKKASLANPVIAAPQVTTPTTPVNLVEALSPADRLATSYVNPEGKRIDATGVYYLDNQGNIIGKIDLTSAPQPAKLTLEQQLAKNANIYFDYDSSQLSSDNQLKLNMHAGYLTTKPAAKIIVEGHTDQRGTREYNLALGDRRANQVQDYLEFTGVKATQISTISYGKEKPVSLEEIEEGYQQNRRAELKYPLVTAPAP